MQRNAFYSTLPIYCCVLFGYFPLIPKFAGVIHIKTFVTDNNLIDNYHATTFGIPGCSERL
jgi:hypothetical protein